MITLVWQFSFPTPLLSYALVSAEVDILADESFSIDFIFILNQRSPAKLNRLRRDLQKFEIPILFNFLPSLRVFGPISIVFLFVRW